MSETSVVCYETLGLYIVNQINQHINSIIDNSNYVTSSSILMRYTKNAWVPGGPATVITFTANFTFHLPLEKNQLYAGLRYIAHMPSEVFAVRSPTRRLLEGKILVNSFPNIKHYIEKLILEAELSDTIRTKNCPVSDWLYSYESSPTE